jgi:hypothetical protein
MGRKEIQQPQLSGVKDRQVGLKNGLSKRTACTVHPREKEKHKQILGHTEP